LNGVFNGIVNQPGSFAAWLQLKSPENTSVFCVPTLFPKVDDNVLVDAGMWLSHIFRFL
jgi:hypothetical protein